MPFSSISLYIALPERKLREAIEKISHEPIYKTDSKDAAKRLWATTFAIAKLGVITLMGAIEKSPIMLLLLYWGERK